MSDDKLIESQLKVPVKGYISLIFAIIFFSGILPAAVGWFASMGIKLPWLYSFDFGKLQGVFGAIDGKNFRGVNGSGARDGFMFAITLLPSVMFAMGVVELVNHFGGIRAAQKVLTPLLRPLLGIPGAAGLALISSLQSTDAGASMTKGLREEGVITENERTIFGMFQFTAGATITNLLSSGVALTSVIEQKIPTIVMISFIVMFAFKILSSNLMRIYVKKFGEEN